LVTRLTNVPVDFTPCIKALLLLGGQWCDRRAATCFARPVHTIKHAARARGEVVVSCGHGRQRCWLGVELHGSPTTATATGRRRRWTFEGICATRSGATTWTGWTRKIRRIRRRTTWSGRAGHRAAQYRDLGSTKDGRTLPLRLRRVAQPGEEFLNGGILSSAHHCSRQHRYRRFPLGCLVGHRKELVEHNGLGATDAAKRCVDHDRVVCVSIQQCCDRNFAWSHR
jgi:hypothetical protein